MAIHTCSVGARFTLETLQTLLIRKCLSLAASAHTLSRSLVCFVVVAHSLCSALLSALAQLAGRRYRRMDEAGTPFCVTVDFDSLEDDTVTIRDRDTCEQRRIKIDELFPYLSKAIDGY